MEPEKIKHLEFIQSIIDRMNSNSFQIKEWMITLVSALLALYASSEKVIYIFVAILPTLLFWWIDSLYLQQERRFRGLYNDIIGQKKRIPSFTMDLSTYKGGQYTQWKCIWSKAVWPFYCLTIVFLIVGGLLIKYWSVIWAFSHNVLSAPCLTSTNIA